MEQFEDKVTPMQLQEEFKWAVGIFPALHKYKIEHNTDNLQKLCVEVLDFCRAIYSSTQNDNERNIYKRVLGKISEL
jgi:hypothetical protein